MAGSCWNADPVVGFSEHLHHFVADVQAEKTTAFDEEAHLIFGVNVLLEKFLAQGHSIRLIGLHADGIDTWEVAPLLRPFDFTFVSRQDLRDRGMAIQLMLCGPAFESDAPLLQHIPNPPALPGLQQNGLGGC